MAGGDVDRNDTEVELLEATGTAIAEYGVSDVTTQKIADEWGRSQSLVHYYYEQKSDLVVAYVEYVHERIAREYAEHAADPPLDRLERVVVNDPCGDDHLDGSLALFDLHGSAPFDDRIRTALNDLEDEARAFVEAAIEDGIAAGTFVDVPSAEAATLLLSAHDGGVLRTAMLGRREDGDTLAAALERYVADVLLTDDARESWDGFDLEETS